MEPHSHYGDELPAGAMLCNGQYRIEGYLNSGGFGVTYLAADSLGRRVVIKECFPSAMCCRSGQTVRLRSQGSTEEFSAILDLFEKEARALAALQHPYIVGVHQYFRDNETAYMAMDFVEGKTLLDIIETEPERFEPRDIKRLLIQILQALGYIHSHDILHRDLSPDNILIDEDNLPVLIDFGAARQDATRVSRALSKVLTVKDGYSPQEFYLHGSEQSFASDLYALAATFYHVVGRAAPPSSHTRMAALARDMGDPFAPLGEIRGYDAYFLAAINTCLAMRPADRLDSADAWRDKIDLERRKQMLLDEAERDRALEEIVRRLVAEFRKDAARDRADKTKTAPNTGGTLVEKTPAPEVALSGPEADAERAKRLSSPPEPDPKPTPVADNAPTDDPSVIPLPSRGRAPAHVAPHRPVRPKTRRLSERPPKEAPESPVFESEDTAPAAKRNAKGWLSRLAPRKSEEGDAS